MNSIKRTPSGRERHWFTDSLAFVAKRIPKIRQRKSLEGQLSLPGMEGEAERNLPAKKKGKKC